MIIVSRDKTVILNFDNTTNVRMCEEDLKTIIANDNSKKTYILGSYKTEERAKEVLQEITQTKSNFEYYKYADEAERNEADPYIKSRYEFFDTYEMPLE